MTRFRPNARFDQVVAAATLEQRLALGEDIRDAAAQIVHHDTGDFANYSLHVEKREDDVVAVFTDSYVGHIIEFGSEDTAPQAPLRTAAAQVGKYQPA